jgi:hypothetical protein
VELLGSIFCFIWCNAFNGILFMTSQSPFTSQGLLRLDKQKLLGRNYVDYGIRMAHAFSPKLAAKANFTYLRGTDWYAKMTTKRWKRQKSCEL